MLDKPENADPKSHSAEIIDFIRDCYVSILSRGPDSVGENYYLEQMTSGGMDDQQVLREIMKSSEASDAKLGLRHLPREGETRDCLEPWFNCLVKANGDVYPCCSHSPIGRIHGNMGLEDVLSGTTSERLRQNLLEGRLDPWCAGCRSAPLTRPERLRDRFVNFFFLDGKVLDEFGLVDLSRHPELNDTYQFRPAAKPGCGIGERIRIRLEGSRDECALTIENVHWPRGTKLSVDIEQTADCDVSVALSVGVQGAKAAKTEVTISGSCRFATTLEFELEDDDCSIVYGARLVDRGAAEIRFSHPFFETARDRTIASAVTPAIRSI